MSKTGENTPYRRGDYWLGHADDAGGAKGADVWAVYWYESTKRRIRSLSTRTADLEEAKSFLDGVYLERTYGKAVCPTCGQVRSSATGHLVRDAISNYQQLHGDDLESASAVTTRLNHVLNYLGTLSNPDVTCEQIDEQWIKGFRKWMAEQPVVSTKGKVLRDRAPGTVETSVVQLSAAINHAYGRHDTLGPAKFKPIPMAKLGRSPHHRSSVEEIAAMFRFCIAPEARTEKLRAMIINQRRTLHRYLIGSVLTLGRPDAVFDMSFDPKRKQWNRQHAVFALNPNGRLQTKKHRAVVPIARQAVPIFNTAPEGYFVGVASVRTAWETMCEALNLPSEGESGMKLIRRSVAHIMRQTLPQEAWGEVTMFLGHDTFDAVSDIYAPFDATYLRRALAVMESVVDQIESLCPGAFPENCQKLHGNCTGIGSKNSSEPVEENLLLSAA